jgi:hypothetical protein
MLEFGINLTDWCWITDVLGMPVKMTPDEKKHYDGLTRKQKIKWTIQKKMATAAEAGKKNPMGQSPYTKTQQKKTAELKRRELALSRKEGESLDVRKMQGRMREQITKHGVDPLEELFLMLKKTRKGKLDTKDRLALLKFMVPYITPQLKAVDIQQETKMTVSVNVQSFKGASQADLRDLDGEVASSEYEDFLIDDDNEGLVVDVTAEVV